MDIKIKSKKILEAMHNYTSIKEGVLPLSLNHIPLSQDEEFIGIYENELEKNILVTTQGIHIFNKETSVFIAYKKIRDVTIPNNNKSKAEHLKLILDDDSSVLVPVQHGRGRFKDVFEFCRFIDRVT